MDEWEEQQLLRRLLAAPRRQSSPEAGAHGPSQREEEDRARDRRHNIQQHTAAHTLLEQRERFFGSSPQAAAENDLRWTGRHRPQGEGRRQASSEERSELRQRQEAAIRARNLRGLVQRITRSLLECCFVFSSIGLVALLFLLHMQFMGTSSCLPASRIVAERPDIVEIRVVGVWWRLAERMKQEMLAQTLSEEERIVAEAIIEGENPEIALARALQREEEERAREAEEEARASGGAGWGWVQRLKFWKKQVERGAEEREARAQKPVPKGWRAWIGLGGKGEEQERVEEEGAMVEVAITGEAERASLLGRSAMGLRWVGGGGHVDDGLEAAIAVTAEHCAALLRQLAQDDALLLLMAMEELDSLVQVPLYLYSREKGLLILSQRSLQSHNVSRMNLTLSSTDECFGGGIISWALEHVVGYDTVMLNQLAQLSAATGRTVSKGRSVEGWVHLVHASDLYNLSVEIGDRSWRDVVLSKLRVIFTCIFLVLATTALVAFTLRETHVRILRFTLQLRYHHRNGVPYLPLLASHLLESLAFVPIMIGVLMFLFEFFDDQMLAFMVFSVVWVSEIFCIVKVRGHADMRRFPQLFLALFCLFLVYIFSFPLGFSYVAFSAWLCAVAATMLYFANHFHHPADRDSSNVTTLGIHMATATFFWI